MVCHPVSLHSTLSASGGTRQDQDASYSTALACLREAQIHQQRAAHLHACMHAHCQSSTSTMACSLGSQRAGARGPGL